MNAKNKQKEEAIVRLKEWIKPGDTIYCVLRSVSRSKMRRTIQFFNIDATARRPFNFLGYNIAQALGERYDRSREGVIVAGLGEDVGFKTVYNLAGVLFGDNRALRSEWI